MPTKIAQLARRQTMAQFDPNVPIEQVVYSLSEEYRNLYNEVVRFRERSEKYTSINPKKYYTKLNLQTPGQSEVHWNNLTNVPDWVSGGTIVGAGVANYIARWTAPNVLGTGSLYDTGALVGVGTAAPATALDVNGEITARTLNAGATSAVITHAAGVLQARTIDARVWGSTLVDNGGANLTLGYMPYATDADTIANSGCFWDSATSRLGINNAAPGTALDVTGEATIGTLNAGATDMVVTHAAGVLQSRTADTRIWGSNLVDNGGANLTAGYMPYATDADTIANSGIYWDNGNNRVSVNGTSPLGAFHAEGTNWDFFTDDIGGVIASATLRTYRNSTGQAQLNGDYARGTKSSPAVVNTDDLIFAFNGRAYNGSSFRPCASMDIYVDGAFSTNGRGRVSLSTRNGGASVEHFVVKADGEIWVIPSGSSAMKWGPNQEAGIFHNGGDWLFNPQYSGSGNSYFRYGNFGIGNFNTYPGGISEKLHVYIEDGGTSSLQTMSKYSLKAAGVAAAGFGIAHTWEMEDSAGNLDIAGIMECLWTTATSASEDAAVVFKTMRNGAAAAERFRVSEDGVESTGQNKVSITRITSADSPYTVLDTDYAIAADTDGGAITVNLPAGEAKRYVLIKNCGSSGNDVTVDGDGAETIDGALTQALADGEAFQIIYETTEEWLVF